MEIVSNVAIATLALLAIDRMRGLKKGKVTAESLNTATQFKPQRT